MTLPKNWHLILASTGDGDRVPGLLDRWSGPVLIHCTSGTVKFSGVRSDEGLYALTDALVFEEPAECAVDPTISMDSRRREVRHLIVDRLSLGVPCGSCTGDGIAMGVKTGDIDRFDHETGKERRCGACGGTSHVGYRVPPYDMRWALSYPGEIITDEQSAEILACSVALVRAGMV